MKLHFLSLLILLFLHYLAPTLANLNSDKQALLHFAAIVPHQQKLNWKPTSPICISWVGITCNENRTRVIAVHLPAVGLYGPIPPNSIRKLDGLRVLSLRFNYLNGNLPSDITSIPSLRALYLQHNNFSGRIPSSLSLQLSALDLSYNSFTGEIPHALKDLTKLNRLNLQFNSFTGPIPNFTFPRLMLFNLSYSMLTGSIPFSLLEIPSFIIRTKYLFMWASITKLLYIVGFDRLQSGHLLQNACKRLFKMRVTIFLQESVISTSRVKSWA